MKLSSKGFRRFRTAPSSPSSVTLSLYLQERFYRATGRVCGSSNEDEKGCGFMTTEEETPQD